ncbi:hypothetical protein [Mycobacteroides abscessus]|uniref:hypothetical protein n=1 Tax=Mycobacteroides abscessus TaxID=36809 RepID=UPI0019D12609|nr:hypothetical protein [Mycobacteroides abscessus]MBN7481034.1 hypothetical protein [Mycobacteroides abscessus subsp. massiliense]
MSSSPFDPITSGLTDLAGAVGVLTTPRLHPMDGETAERADDLAVSRAHTAVQTEDWLAGLVETSQAQSDLDHKLSSCMTPAALAEWRTRIARLGDREQQMAEISHYLAEEKKRREALAEHAAGTFTSLPECPVSDDVPASITGEQTAPGGTEKDSADGDRLGDEGEGSTEETPVTMSTDTPQTPVTMSTDTGSPRATMSDSSAGTELSSSTMADPSTRAALSGQMAPTQGTPQVSGGSGQPAAMGGVPVSQQLSQPARGGSGGGAGRTRRSPEARREDQDKQAEKDATVQAASAVTLAGAGGAMGAAMTSTPSSPGTTTSGAPSAPVAPTAAAAPQGTPPAGAGGAGMAGMPRGGSLGSGNGVSNPKPVLASEQPLTPEELDRLLKGEDDKKDGTK